MDGLLEAPHDVEDDGTTVTSKRWVPGAKGPMSLMRNFPDPEALVDFWMRVRWQAPGLCGLDFGATLAGRPEADGIWRRGTHLLTPETEGSTHYFFASTRNYRLDDPDEDRNIMEWQRIGFNEQDKPMLEAVQQMMGTTDLMGLRPVFLSADKAAVRARKLLADRLAHERQEQHGNAA
jgi:vanillate O-demethylase monooxygenase subunit